MNFWTITRRSLAYHWRIHAGVVLGAAVGSMTLTGALLIGDSVRHTLVERARARLGFVQSAMTTGDRLFRAGLAAELEASGSSTTARICPMLLLKGAGSRPDGQARANHVNILGVEAGRWPALAGWRQIAGSNTGPDNAFARWRSGELVAINASLARQLAVKEGDEILVRVQKPQALGQDAIVSARADSIVALRMQVGRVVGPESLGDFGLYAGQRPLANAFVSLEFLQHQLGIGAVANAILAGEAVGSVSNRLDQVWRLEDAGLAVRTVEPRAWGAEGSKTTAVVEVTSAGVFLDESVIAAGRTPCERWLTNRADLTNDTLSDVALRRELAANAHGILTLLANSIRAGDRLTPYSMVTAADSPLTLPDMLDSEVLINEWLAEDLKAKAGDIVEIAYYVPDSGPALIERTNRFRVRSVVPLEGRYADRTLMPDFPGLAQAENERDWDIPFPLAHKIRDKDESYWKQHRGTPKAFVTLAAGRRMWASRFGELTALRYEIPANAAVSACREAVYRNLLGNLTPDAVGLRFEPVRQQAIAAALQSQDFGQLLLGFSIFLIAAALLLMGLIFEFGLEQRASEAGTLLALGFTVREVRRLRLAEGAALALAGGFIGACAAIAYSKGLLLLFSAIGHRTWGVSFDFRPRVSSLAVGVCASSLVAIIVSWLVLRRQGRESVTRLFTGEAGHPERGARGTGLWVGLSFGLAAIGTLAWALAGRRTDNPAAFFGAGACLLVAQLTLASHFLSRLGASKTRPGAFTLGRLVLAGCVRRRSRSLATLAMLASGCFVVLAVSAFHLDSIGTKGSKACGTGGFALIGESTLPILRDPAKPENRDSLGLDGPDASRVSILSFRMREGDDASCLNLNRARSPRLLGVRPELLEGRFTFSSAIGGGRDQGWTLLARPLSPDATTAEEAIPAIGDANSIHWALGKKVGDTLDYTDEAGRKFKLRLVGAVANSILQGSLIIDDGEFVKKFPGESGYRFFLLDVPPGRDERVSAALSEHFEDVGLELTPAERRMETLNAVQNTYLAAFQFFGGLGVLLGTAGLGVVVLRNVLERKSELAAMQAVGFRRRKLLGLVSGEHGILLGLGVGMAALAAGLTALPLLLAGARPLSGGLGGLLLGGVILNGAVWTLLAARYALAGNLLEALRNE